MSDTENDGFIGEPEIGNKEKKSYKNANWRIDDSGEQVYRILPPCHSLAKSGRWSFYDAIHWGFQGTNGKMKPFRCIQQKNHKTKMITQECPACTWIEGKRNDYNKLLASLKEDKRSKEDIERMTGDQFKWLMRFNTQKGHYVNAMKQSGEIGRLFLKIKCKQNLDVLNEKLKAKDKNAISASKGLWLVFSKEGKGTQTVYPVSVLQEDFQFNGQTFTKDKDAPLTADIINRMRTEAFDLATVYQDVTYDQILQLVGSSADPQTVDSVFGLPKTQPMTQEVEEPDDDLPETAIFQKPVATPVPAPTSVKVTPTAPDPVQVQADEEAALEAQLAAMRAKRAPQKVTPKVQTQPTQEETMELAKAFSIGKL
jgi:hypothetical protein